MQASLSNIHEIWPDSFIHRLYAALRVAFDRTGRWCFATKTQPDLHELNNSAPVPLNRIADIQRAMSLFGNPRCVTLFNIDSQNLSFPVVIVGQNIFSAAVLALLVACKLKLFATLCISRDS